MRNRIRVPGAAFQVGESVALVTDSQHRRMITSLIVSPNGILYGVSLGTESTTHYAVELMPWPAEKTRAGFAK